MMIHYYKVCLSLASVCKVDPFCHQVFVHQQFRHCSKPCVWPEAGAPAALGAPEVTRESDLSSEAETNFEVERDFVAVINCHSGISSEAGTSSGVGSY